MIGRERRGAVHVSTFSAACTAFGLLPMLLFAAVEVDVTTVPAALWALYNLTKLFEGNVLKSEVDRHRIRRGAVLISA